MQFDFGENWANYSMSALNPDRIAEAQSDFKLLTSDIQFKGKSFLDIGFGQGLSLLFADVNGASCYGCDINPKCKTVLFNNQNNFFKENIKEIPVVIGSILDQSVVDEIKKMKPEEKQFDIVHSWGVLHHTGNMYQAIENVISLVKENGYLILAIYNKHWSSGAWLFIKWLYNKSPVIIKWLMTQVFYIIIAITKFLITGKNPFKQERGMNFYFDVIDWVGGYPYEYASSKTIIDLISAKGFTLEKFCKAKVPTGCNEFVFKMNTKL